MQRKAENMRLRHEKIVFPGDLKPGICKLLFTDIWNMQYENINVFWINTVAL
jgi:hypothetical protein